ncbi:nucleoside hydrolase-like [Phymastichus coffea]|uniref:nucleoside hydrolase-like n=1 Tax=Phymastichus coffea TaxID=108790 RepID=UPI00273AFB08|nr:nucleoside hydrolase-like [Phymastichus coffea]
MDCQKIIVDCDAGADDALALIILIEAHKLKKVKLLAITCVAGNTKVENVVNNVFRILHLCNSTNIPVYKGAYSPLLHDVDAAKRISENLFHGSDGFGDAFKDKPDISKLKEEHATQALHRIVTENYEEVSILCMAPLTNIALTIKMYPDFAHSVRRFFIMGGNFSAVGNITSQAEFNFYFDPESVHIVFFNAAQKLWLLPWETTLKSSISFEWRDNVFGKIDTPAVELMNAIEENIYKTEHRFKESYNPCDFFIAAILLRPDVAKDIGFYYIDIELGGTKTRGQVVVDHLMSHEPNAYIIQNIDTEICKDLLMFVANPNAESSQVLWE